jgi:hypothetical protein
MAIDTFLKQSGPGSGGEARAAAMPAGFSAGLMRCGSVSAELAAWPAAIDPAVRQLFLTP